MFIRRTTTRRRAAGEAYHTYRLVESRREGDRVRQTTLLNLGRHFDLAEEHGPSLCARLAQRLGPQGTLVAVDLPEPVEAAAQALAAQFVARTPASTEAAAAEFVAVDVHSLELIQPRSVGVEHVGLHALALLEFEPLLAGLGINATPRAMILAQGVARMAAPGSERSTWGWLNETSAWGELLGLSFTDLSIMRLYRAADVRVKPQGAIEAARFDRVRDLFGFEATVPLYDLTNTYFEGGRRAIPRRGGATRRRSAATARSGPWG